MRTLKLTASFSSFSIATGPDSSTIMTLLRSRSSLTKIHPKVRKSIFHILHSITVSFCLLVFALIGNFDFNRDGKISFGEFVQSLWQLQRMDDAKEVMMVSNSIRTRSIEGTRTGVSVQKNTVSPKQPSTDLADVSIPEAQD